MRIRFLHTEGFRLAAIYAGIFVLSAAAMGAAVMVITDRALREQVDEFARADIAAITDGYRTDGIGEAREVIGQRMAAPGASDYFLLQKDGRRLAGNLPLMQPRLGAFDVPSPARHGHVIFGEGALLAPGLYVFSGSDLHRIHAAHEHILQLLLWLFLAALLLAVAGGALVSRSFLRRADSIATACRRIMNGDLKTRIPMRGTQDELDRLAEAINEMLGRIVALMENLHQVTNDIAHDLRTPVTHLRHRLERARGDSRDLEDYRGALDSAILASDEILALFAALLRIAQIEGGARRAGFAVLDLTAVMEHMREVFAPVAEDSGHILTAALAPAIRIRGDRELLIQLFSNLIENAIVHTETGARIALSLRAADGHAIVRVADNGPGVPHDEHERLFRRLYRREASRTRPGYGLGLSLVAAITELHGSSARIVTGSEPGFCIELSFPLAG